MPEQWGQSQPGIWDDAKLRLLEGVLQGIPAITEEDFQAAAEAILMLGAYPTTEEAEFIAGNVKTILDDLVMKYEPTPPGEDRPGPPWNPYEDEDWYPPKQPWPTDEEGNPLIPGDPRWPKDPDGNPMPIEDFDPRQRPGMPGQPPGQPPEQPPGQPGQPGGKAPSGGPMPRQPGVPGGGTPPQWPQQPGFPGGGGGLIPFPGGIDPTSPLWPKGPGGGPIGPYGGGEPNGPGGTPGWPTPPGAGELPALGDPYTEAKQWLGWLGKWLGPEKWEELIPEELREKLTAPKSPIEWQQAWDELKQKLPALDMPEKYTPGALGDQYSQLMGLYGQGYEQGVPLPDWERAMREMGTLTPPDAEREAALRGSIYDFYNKAFGPGTDFMNTPLGQLLQTQAATQTQGALQDFAQRTGDMTSPAAAATAAMLGQQGQTNMAQAALQAREAERQNALQQLGYLGQSRALDASMAQEEFGQRAAMIRMLTELEQQARQQGQNERANFLRDLLNQQHQLGMQHEQQRYGMGLAQYGTQADLLRSIYGPYANFMYQGALQTPQLDLQRLMYAYGIPREFFATGHDILGQLMNPYTGAWAQNWLNWSQPSVAPSMQWPQYPYQGQGQGGGTQTPYGGLTGYGTQGAGGAGTTGVTVGETPTKGGLPRIQGGGFTYEPEQTGGTISPRYAIPGREGSTLQQLSPTEMWERLQEQMADRGYQGGGRGPGSGPWRDTWQPPAGFPWPPGLV